MNARTVDPDKACGSNPDRGCSDATSTRGSNPFAVAAGCELVMVNARASRQSPLGASTKKHSLKLNGHMTSVSLEDVFWDAVLTIAEAKRVTIRDLIANIDAAKGSRNLSSAIRLFVLEEAKGGRLGRHVANTTTRPRRRASTPVA